MLNKRLLWQLYPTYLLVILITLTLIAWHTSTTIHWYYQDILQDVLSTRARLIKYEIDIKKFPLSTDRIDPICKDYGALLNTRITVIRLNGEVVGESNREPEDMENHKNRPEFIEALAGRPGMSIRFSNTLKQNMMYVAIPYTVDGQNIGAVRTSIPSTAIDTVLRTIYFQIALGGAFATLIAALVSFMISRRIIKPLELFKHGVERFSRGDFSTKLEVPDTEELSVLAEAMNRMSDQLDERIQSIIQQRNQQQAIFSSMTEGVLAVRNDKTLIGINSTAGDWLDINPLEDCEKSILDLIKNPDLYSFITRSLSSQEPEKDEIILEGKNDSKIIQVYSAALYDSLGDQTGSVIVMNDVTQIRRLENIRRDFVANVSHELKTPITSIKGYVETLLDGALNDNQNAERFLGIISKQTDRLHAIIEDLLSLSRIEKGENNITIPMVKSSLSPVIESAIECCRQKADEKHISIRIDVDDDPTAAINPPLLEQAIVNLVDNAIKYSGENGAIDIIVRQDNTHTEITVRDEGCGIPQEHIPRLFERFYRVDKARSRKLGGTGLGLSIVKHIVQTHKGSIQVESELEKGSSFTIFLPNAD